MWAEAGEPEAAEAALGLALQLGTRCGQVYRARLFAQPSRNTDPDPDPNPDSNPHLALTQPVTLFLHASYETLLCTRCGQIQEDLRSCADRC